MIVKNPKGKDEETEYEMSVAAHIDYMTLIRLRTKNIIPRSLYRCSPRGKSGRSFIYIYKVKETLECIERLRDEGIINKKRRRKEIRQ